MHVLLWCLFGAVAGTLAIVPDPAHAEMVARFTVSAEIRQPAVEPFTATVNPIGNGSDWVRAGSGFEPVVFRHRYMVTADASDRVIARPVLLTHWNSLRTGALDGARVDVYRIENRAVRHVRTDTVPEGGFQVSGWRPLDGRKLVPPGHQRYELTFPGYYRRRADAWIGVRAVHVSGTQSDVSEPVVVRTPAEPSRAETHNDLVAFEPRERRKRVRSLTVPQNVTVTARPDGLFDIRWDDTGDPGIAGYRVVISEMPPERHRGHYILLESGDAGPPLRKGDMAIVSKKITDLHRSALVTDRVWGARGETGVFHPGLFWGWSDTWGGRPQRLAPHTPDTPVTDPGETYLELTLKRRVIHRIRTRNHGGTGQDFRPVFEPVPHVMDVWLRSDEPSRVIFSVTGPYAGAIRPAILVTGPEWRRFKIDFTPPRVLEGTGAGVMELAFTGPGTFGVDNFRIYRADAPYMALLPEDRERLVNSGMTAWRTHSFIKTGRRSYDLAQLTNPGGVIGSTAGLETLPSVLTLMQAAGMMPWLQVEPHFTPEEWLGLVEFLAAPFDPAVHDAAERPWAAKRHAQGRAAPWTDAFDRFYFELGNETWNSLFAPWTFSAMIDAADGRELPRGEVYGLFNEHVIGLMRSSPYWTDEIEAKFRFVLGGWSGNPNYSSNAARGSPSADYLTIGAYNGGWDEREGPPRDTPASLFNVLNQITQVTAPRARALAGVVKHRNRQTDGDLRPGTYEAGPGYALNGLNGARVEPRQIEAQERVMKSQAAGVATLDSFLDMASKGFALQNFFTYGPGNYWRSHAPWHEGGEAYPSWALLSLFNRIGTGDLLWTRRADDFWPVADLQGTRWRPEVLDAPLVSVYATRDDDRLTVFVLSRQIAGHPDAGSDGYTPVTIDLPISGASGLTLYRMAGPPQAHGATPRPGDPPRPTIERVVLEPAEVGPVLRLGEETGADAAGLPPGSAFVYVFDKIF